MQTQIAIACIGICLGLGFGVLLGNVMGSTELIHELGFRSWDQFNAWKEQIKAHNRRQQHYEMMRGLRGQAEQASGISPVMAGEDARVLDKMAASVSACERAAMEVDPNG